MTRDISKLLVLKLRNPKLLIVRGEDTASGLNNESNGQAANAVRDTGEGLELPTSLAEFCVPVGDGTEKPLYLVELLASRILPSNAEDHHTEDEPMTALVGSSALESRDDSDSDDDSISSSDVSSESSVVSSASDSASEPETTSSIDDAADESEHEQSAEPAVMHPSRAALLDDASQTLTPPTVLVFTSSNEAAQRLSHLLRKLRPQWSSWISTMTKTPTKRPSWSRPSLPSITISTDRAARGLDVLFGRAITHVVQYDVPRSLSSYVHRAGRTARAGRNGDAWTLYTHSEARWFLHEVTKAPGLWRAQPVDKVKLEVHDESLRERYQQALGDMRDEVFGDGPSK